MILTTRMEPVARDRPASLQPARLTVIADGVAAEFVSDMGYGDTNDLINSMQTLGLGEQPLATALRYDGASMWQFLPSYIWPDVFRAVEMTKVLTAAVDEHSPS